MTRLAAGHRVFYFEEPVFDEGGHSCFEAYKDELHEVYVITPRLPEGLSASEAQDQQALILGSVLQFYAIRDYVAWHYSPMTYALSQHLNPLCRVYDCMDELSNFLFAPPALKENEAALLQKSDVVFTGGNSLYQAKKKFHNNIHCFPSSIDKAHFKRAREIRLSAAKEPEDQASIQRPRIGFFGVIDERLHIEMLRELAAQRPSWQFILIGPVVKIDPRSLPRQDNIHYLGAKPYTELPQYLAGWDIAMMPFVLNASTEFISPTKTPEYLAGGVPVIAPSIRDVVNPYFGLGLISIADTTRQFIKAAENILGNGMPKKWLEQVDQFLADLSWDRTVAEMARLIEEAIQQKSILSDKKTTSYV